MPRTACLLLQERIMTIPYGVGESAEVFKYSLFLVFCNRMVAATIAAITLVVSVKGCKVF
jgi:adenosine 3'-phospho 5'-phosphosulfate transporter B2